MFKVKILISYITASKSLDENIILKRIVSADEMFDECSKVFNDIDVFIMSAAVSDYKPSKKNHNKISQKLYHESYSSCFFL